MARKSMDSKVWKTRVPRDPQLLMHELDDLKRSPEHLNNVKICQGQRRLIMVTYFILPYMGVAAILVK